MLRAFGNILLGAALASVCFFFLGPRKSRPSFLDFTPTESALQVPSLSLCLSCSPPPPRNTTAEAMWILRRR